MPKVIVGSSFVAQYPQGGGVFSVVLQYLLGLRRLGCKVCWLELLSRYLPKCYRMWGLREGG